MIEAITAFFAFGALGFWVLAIVASIVFIACIENDRIVVPTLLTIGLIAVYFKSLTGITEVITWRFLVGGIIAYVLSGSVWSFIKWGSYTRIAVKDFKRKNISESELKRRVDVSYNKARITGWLVWWLGASSGVALVDFGTSVTTV